MKNSIALILSIVATLLAGSALFLSKKNTGSDPPSAGLPIAPQSEPELLGRCGERPPVKDLEELMKLHVNPSLTRVSFSLHHDERELAERMDIVASCAAQLVESVRMAPSFRADVPLDRLPEYYRHFDSLQGHAAAMKIAALEGDERSAVHWYMHLKNDCLACHARFRP